MKGIDRELARLSEQARAGRIPRRDFLQRAGLVLGGMLLPSYLIQGCTSQSTPADSPKLAGAAPSQTLPAVSRGLSIAGARDLLRLDPRYIDLIEEFLTILHVTEPLVQWGDGLQLKPNLAQAWEAVDPNTWKFTLRQNVKFHNGEAFTADAVKFTMDEVRKAGEKYPWHYLWAGFEGVEVVDTHTVVFKSAMPMPVLPRNLASLGIIPPEAGSKREFSQHPIGTGPFKFVRWQKDAKFEAESFSEYWGGSPKVTGLVFRAIPDASARVVALQAGEIDAAIGIPPDLVAPLRRNKDLTIIQQPGIRIAHYPFNFRSTSAIKDVKVRQALTMCIDGDSILTNILNGAAHPLQGPVPSAFFGAANLGGYRKADPEKAKALLMEAGFPFDYAINVIYAPGEFIKDKEVTEAVQAMLAKAGIKVKVDTLDAGAYNARRSTPNWDVAINGYSAVTGDPGLFLEWATGPAFGYPHQETIEAIKRSSQAVDLEQRRQLLADAQKLYWESVPYLFGYSQTDSIGVRKAVQGLKVPGIGWVLANDVVING